ncbi:MAG TPA: phosphoribosylformylglycinamidine cyclo-ligase [Leptospiraceae bacterium]|nr:phosphoribosylformylglycinamidine cyclo-ligase [Leptospiraceae bacterium]HMW04135.1 phosphoribosylformylglycinamidine cyclo-ligase [Leptospiraceae bacterium]HMX30798.1 phosphoribosylformylglycinamidine cyclo-ligase [Leptospiraceae bacterium]HMY30128.1 phosphoribosylformylglycinamidine cyclo-ligase [Leptospiraceae bacterium]HMZ64365.1 phosphoribosylformylglycinamidine cyclo-ligase [Leptospiraceae bacterium]
MSNNPITYKDAGVDTEAGRDFVNSIKKNVHSTHNPRVLGGLGGFAAAYDVSFLKNYKEPILLSCTDGVGTKLELARLLDKHDTIGIDLVAMSVNDLLVSGARPLFFLDYISCGKLDIQKMEKIVSGIVTGCKLCGAALVGGETAEHPGTMKPDEYDLAGFAVGAVEKSELIDGSKIQSGDLIVGIESSGPHSNGYSLIRKLYLENGALPSDKQALAFISDYLMKPTRIYVDPILKLLQKEEIKGMIHITGGGFYENIPRIFGKELAARIIKKDLPESYVFNKIKKDHSLDEKDMYSTFNMGVGFILIIPKDRGNSVLQELAALGESAKIIGEIINRNSEEVEMVD